MGITIHYTITYPLEITKSLVTGKPMLNALDLDHTLREIRDYIYERYPNLAELTEMQAIQDYDGKKKIGFSVWVDRGCETLAFYFYPKVDLEKGIHVYKCRSFCKTEYAEDFITSHIIICEILDLFQNKGFTLDILDEAEYFETRDISKLAKNKESSEALIGSLINALKNAGIDVKGDGIKYVNKSVNPVEVNNVSGVIVKIAKGEAPEIERIRSKKELVTYMKKQKEELTKK